VADRETCGEAGEKWVQSNSGVTAVTVGGWNGVIRQGIDGDLLESVGSAYQYHREEVKYGVVRF